MRQSNRARVRALRGRASIAAAVVVSLLCVAGARPVGATIYGYLAFDVPGASITYGLGINNAGQIVGSYDDGSGRHHGFVKDGDTYTLFDVPGAKTTNAWGINDGGQVVGGYQDASGAVHGFLKDGATYTAFDYPGAFQTGATRIDDAGRILGGYFDTSLNHHGYLKDGATYSPFDVPGATSTTANGMNEAGQIVGYYDSPTAGFHSFLWDGSSFTSFDVGGLTFAYDINALGQIVGNVHVDVPGGVFAHAFVKEGDTYQYVDGLGSIGGLATGINDDGAIVGYYTDGVRKSGFLAVPVPESGSAVLVAAGVIALSAWRRRRGATPAPPA